MTNTKTASKGLSEEVCNVISMFMDTYRCKGWEGDWAYLEAERILAQQAAPAPAAQVDEDVQFWKRMTGALADIIQDAAPIVGKGYGEESAQEIGRLLKLKAAQQSATPAVPVRGSYSDARKAYVALTNAVVFDGDRPRYIATKEMMDCFDAFFATPADAAPTVVPAAVDGLTYADGIDSAAEVIARLAEQYSAGKGEPVGTVLNDLVESVRALLAAPDCTRSHPHENMDAACEAKTVEARARNAAASAQQVQSAGDSMVYYGGGETPVHIEHAQPSAPASGDEREAFEAWFYDQMQSGRNLPKADMYAAWKASAAQPRQRVELTDAEILRIFEKETGFSTESNYCIVDADILGYTRAILATNSGAETSEAARDVLAERARQVSVEGWTSEHDDQHPAGQMASAAGCYAMFTVAYPAGDPVGYWPWDKKWWKPAADNRRNLVKAGALILAEIERIDRAAIAAERARQAGSNTGEENA